jgi:hypothetical protein
VSVTENRVCDRLNVHPRLPFHVEH